MKMIRLIASDIDGTLLRDEGQALNPEVFEMIRELKDHDVHFVAASGRQYVNLRRLFAPVANDISYVAENGSLCYSKDKLLFKGAVGSELSMEILDVLDDFPHCSRMVSGEEICYTDSKDSNFIHHLQHVLKNDIVVVDNLKTDVPEEILKMSICDFETVPTTLHALQEIFGSRLKIITSGNIWVDFITPGANKGIALGHLLKKLNVDAKDCAAFGDQFNDAEMLELVGAGYAMEDAPEGLKAKANFVTNSVEQELRKILDSFK